MMFFVISLFFLYLGLNVTNGASVSTPRTVTGILGDVLTIECQYGQSPDEMLNQIEWQAKLDNGRYVQLAVAIVTPQRQARTEVVTDNINLAFTSRSKNDNELSFQLTFLRIACADSRDYKCRATYQDANNKTQTATTTTGLDVSDRPDVAPTVNFNTPIMESAQTQFTCSGIVGRPAGRLVWKTSTNTQDLQIQTVSQTESSCLITRTEQLTLPLNRQNQTVTISCEIEHNLVTSPLVTTVGPFDILYPPDQPTLRTEPSLAADNVLDAGSSVFKLICSTDSNPAANYIWSFNGEPAGNGNELMIQTVDLSHSGNYTCTVTNTLGESSSSVDIMVGETTTNVINGSGTAASQSSTSMVTVIIAVVLTSLVWLVIAVVVAVIYRKKFCGGTIKKRKLKEMPPVSGFNSSNYDPNYSSDYSQQKHKDKTALTNMGAETDDYLVPDEINVPHRVDSTTSHQYENTRSIYSKAANINNVDHNGYTLSRELSHPENYYDEILRKNTVRSDISDYNHDYMEPI